VTGHERLYSNEIEKEKEKETAEAFPSTFQPIERERR
jgi:hypothetical protein